MKDPYLLHVFSPTRYVSPFDINMAYEAHYDAVIPYCNVTLDEIHPLTQDTIFSRSPVGVNVPSPLETTTSSTNWSFFLRPLFHEPSG